MPQSTYLLEQLERQGRLAPAELTALERWWAANRADGESLPDCLVRHGLLSRTGIRTLELMRKGFVADDLRAVFGTDDHRKLAETLRSFAPLPAAETKLLAGLPDRPVGVPSPVTARDPEPTVAGEPFPPATETLLAPTRVPPAADTRPGRVPEVGDTLGKCLLTGVLGRGGHGIVFSALHQTLNIAVAVKVLVADGAELDETVRRHLRREAQMLARLNHQNITRVLDYDDTATPFVIIELVEGPSLADLIAMTGRVHVGRAAEIFAQAAEGLKAAWEFGIVHRDIKPGNILLTRTGTAKIADLGLAIAAGDRSRLKADGAGLVGTCGYVSPEQARAAREVDFRADIYSLGATMYHAVTGRLPFDARSAREMLMKHAATPVVPPAQLAAGVVDEATSTVIVRMMAKEPADRYQSYDALIDDLRALAKPPTTPPPVSASSAGPKSGVLGRFFQFRSKSDGRGEA